VIVPGIGGTISAGERRPFFVALWDRLCRASRVKRFLVLGAEATRRINRDALADMLRGDSGPPVRGGVWEAPNDCWDELAVCVDGVLRTVFLSFSDLSDLVRERGDMAMWEDWEVVCAGEEDDLAPAWADRA
jgi:hypothetical protein